MYFLNIINSIGDSYLAWKNVYNIIGKILVIMMAYKTLYWLIGVFFTRKFKPAKNKHKYAILIAARNEKNVIGNLLDSINKQDYPKELITTFVVADNCTDNTAEIARKHGAICYERFDNEHKTKGFALQYLLEKIGEDYGRMSFEGYFIFDADNLLNGNYISKMNDAFDSGEKIITSYRNTKNFDENWIASTYAIHWIRSIRCNHRARSVLRLATNIQGGSILLLLKIEHLQQMLLHRDIRLLIMMKLCFMMNNLLA
jgi:cellulose synthase/poly-beta-1,6-N-acetylglucosamine synthase-like glycosyltransferase